MEETEPLEAQLTHSVRVLLSHWIPQQWGVMPCIRVGRRWFNLVWLIPIGIVFLAIGIPVAQEVLQIPVVREFLLRYPGQTSELGASLLGAMHDETERGDGALLRRRVVAIPKL